MNTFDGYIRRDGTNSKVLLDGGDAKALSSFIGTLSYTNNKITYTKADGTSYDLVDLSNYIYNLRAATSDNLGGIKIGFLQSGKNYPVQLDSNNKAYVYVPWEENSHYTTRLYVGDGTAENKITTNGNTRITVTDNNNVRNYITLIGSGATNISSDDNGKITIKSINTTYNTGDSATLNKGTNTEGKLWSAKTLVDYISDILGVDSTAITSLNTLIGQLHDNDTATGILVELAKKLNTPSSSIGSNNQPIYWNGSSFTTIGYTIEKSVPSSAIFTDTKYSLYVGENNNIKEHKNVSNPYFKLFENNNPTSIQIKAGTGISVSSDINGNITIKNESPDQNHNTWRPIKIEGTEKLGSATNTDALNLTAGNGIEVSYDSTNKKVIIKNTKPDQNHDTHYTTSMYIGENNDIKANKAVNSPYFKLFDNDTRRSTLRFIAGSGIGIVSDDSGNITIQGPDLSGYAKNENLNNYLPLTGGTVLGTTTFKTDSYGTQLEIYRNTNNGNPSIKFNNTNSITNRSIGFETSRNGDNAFYFTDDNHTNKYYVASEEYVTSRGYISRYGHSIGYRYIDAGPYSSWSDSSLYIGYGISSNVPTKLIRFYYSEVINNAISRKEVAQIGTDGLSLLNNRIWINSASETGGTTNRLELTSGLPSGYGQNKKGTLIYSNGIAFLDPYNTGNNDGAWIRHIETTGKQGTLEIAVGNDAINEEIHFRWYNTSNQISKDIIVPRNSGTIALTSDLSNYLTTTTNQIVSGIKTFNGGCWTIAASESNEITTEYFGTSKYYNNANTEVISNGWSITNAIKFRWYSDYWLIGNIRSGNTNTAGFGIALRDNTNNRQIDCFRVTKEESYIKGYVALHTGNSSVSKSGETLTVNIGGTSYSLTNTNTWRGITDSYSGTDSTISLSQKGGNNLYNTLLNGYASAAGYARQAEYSHILDLYGYYSSSGLSFYQTQKSFDDSPEGWAHYIIANHGNGESYYHYTIRLPFWGIPQYKRQIGSTSNVSKWYKFITEENIDSQSVKYANYLNLVYGNEIRFNNIPSSSTDVYFNQLWAGGIADDKINDYCFMNGNKGYAGIIAERLSCTNGYIYLYGPGSGIYNLSGIFSNSYGLTIETPRTTDSLNGTVLPLMVKTRGGQWSELQSGILELYPDDNNGYKEGIRMHTASNGWTTLIFCGTDNTGTSGTSTNSWGIYTREGNFYINRNNSNIATVNRLWGHSNGYTIGNTTESGYNFTVGGTSRFIGTMTTSHILPASDNTCNIGSNAAEYANTFSRAVFARHLNASSPYSADKDLYLGYNSTTNILFYVTDASGNNRKNVAQFKQDGNAIFNNTVTASSFYSSSDIRLKNIISNIQYSSEEIASLRSVKYTWKNKNEKVHIGSIAQDVERIIPEVVNIDNEGYKSLDYATLGAIGVISLAREIVELKKEIKELKSKLYG